MDELQIFRNEEFGQIRTLIENGKTYFVAADVAKALGYTNTRKAVNDHCKGVTKRSTLTAGGQQEVNVIRESDVYRLIIKSQLPSAAKFETWVFEEVLPSIRKHGGYLTPEKIEEALSDPDTIIRLATDLKNERKKRVEVEKTNSLLMHVNKTYTATEIAKEIGFRSATALNADLEERKIQYKQNGTWVLYSKYADKGYVDIKQEILSNGTTLYHRKWTQLGREFLLNLYERGDSRCS